ncbi:MAG: hypothetical protein RLY61_38 [Candidatus Parcubacteria bacterium]
MFFIDLVRSFTYALKVHKTLTFLLVLSYLLLNNFIAFSQNLGIGFGVGYEIEAGKGREGHIVSVTDKGTYKLSTVSYDPKMFGVIVNQTPLTLVDETFKDAKIVISSGETKVLVNGEGGSISKGDFITASSAEGMGMKATSSGYVLGIALEDFKPKTPKESKLMLVNLRIGNQFISTNPRSNLLQVLKSGLDAPTLAPLESLRYLLSGLAVVAAFIIGFASFGKTSSTSIEAMGRNPLAKNTIQTTVFFNFLLTGLIMFSGVFLAYLILII